MGFGGGVIDIAGTGYYGRIYGSSCLCENQGSSKSEK